MFVGNREYLVNLQVDLVMYSSIQTFIMVVPHILTFL